jgi:hypothetical protein
VTSADIIARQERTMYRWSLLTLGSTLFVGLAAVNPGVMNWHGERSPAAREEAHRRECARVIGIADALNLYWVADPPDCRMGCRLLVSELPIAPDRQDRLHLHNPEFERWRGTVAVYVGRASITADNYDADHPERHAVWGDSFVWGDPELIRALFDATR